MIQKSSFEDGRGEVSGDSKATVAGVDPAIVVSYEPTPIVARYSAYILAKRVSDIVISLLAVIVLGLGYMAKLVAAKLRSGRSATVRESFVGRYGVPFHFNVLGSDLGDGDSVANSSSGLQKLGSRDLVNLVPMFCQVIVGRMSLVGPSLHRLAETKPKDLKEATRYLYRPGVFTCLTCFRSDSLSSAQRDEIELAYVKCCSLSGDLRILIGSLFPAQAQHDATTVASLQSIPMAKVEQVISVSSTRSRGRFYLVAKRSFDLLGSFTLMVLFSPVFLLVSLAVLLADGWPVFFLHKRVGQHGHPFRMFKFRTMRRNAEKILRDNPEMWQQFQVNFKLENDPRVTRVGRFLRKTSMDELPQLLNVVLGDMSLVGPRPVVEEELERFGADLDLVLSVRPGVTGLWQCSGRSDVSYEERTRWEVTYLETASFWLDVKIIFKTVWAVLKREGAH